MKMCLCPSSNARERLSEVDRGKADGWGHRANGEVGREV